MRFSVWNGRIVRKKAPRSERKDWMYIWWNQGELCVERRHERIAYVYHVLNLEVRFLVNSTSLFTKDYPLMAGT